MNVVCANPTDENTDEAFLCAVFIIKMTLLSKWQYYCISFTFSKIARVLISQYFFGMDISLSSLVGVSSIFPLVFFIFWFLEYEQV